MVNRLRQWQSPTAFSVMQKGVGAGLRFDAGSSNSAYALGDNELPVQQELALRLRAGDVFYDVGANVGFLAVIGARLVGSTGSVYAFEPVPSNADLIERNADANGLKQITIVKKAVGSYSGRGGLVLADYSGGAALDSVEPPPDAAGRIPIELVSIDDLVFSGRFKPPSFVKIDVEGAEIDVLRGMRRTLLEYRPVVLFEIDDVALDGLIRKRTECEQFLLSCGYEVSQLEPSYAGLHWHVEHFLARPESRG